MPTSPPGTLEPASSPVRSDWHRVAFALLLLIAAGGILGRIAAVRSKSGQTPMLSANDRSRWSNVRALVDHGTYAVDQVVLNAAGKRDPEWYSIDMVKHRGADGREHFYSSKPTLFNTILAAPYWVLRQATGISIAAKPHFVIRLLLVLVNFIPFIVYAVLLGHWTLRYAQSPFAKLMVFGAALFGTFLSTFTVTINNHLPAAITCLGAVGCTLRIVEQRASSAWWYALVGLLAAATAANELPALSFLCLVGGVVAWVSWRHFLIAFTPAALLVAVAAFGTNYLAHGTWSTPYAHRKDGRLIASTPRTDSPLTAGSISTVVNELFTQGGVSLSPRASLAGRPAGAGWVVWDPETEKRWAIREAGSQLELREWDNWYEYEGSYWSGGRKQGVDRGEPSQGIYAFHAVLGHHGIFSLTPLWGFSLIGALIWWRRGERNQQVLAAGTILLTLVCLTFFLFLRPLEDRNYGGVSCCFRWTLWLTPLWLLCLIPGLDWAAGGAWRRALAGLALLISVFSASYNQLNPWSHPWLFDYWTHLGWIRY